MKILALSAAAVCGLASTILAPAHAQTVSNALLVVSIPLDDIDLGSPAGQQELDRRIKNATRKVCRVTDPQTGERLMSKQTRACVARAKAQAEQQLAALIDDRQRGG